MADRIADEVLTSVPPAFSEIEAAAIARELFRVDGAARAAGSERDQTFLLDGDRPAVLKISNAAEDPDRLDMEALAAQRIALVDPELPVPLPWRVPGALSGPDAVDDDPGAYRAEVRSADGAVHHARLYDRLPGHANVLGATLSDDAVRAWGAAAARVARALRGFAHPSAIRTMLWDPQHALRLRPLLDHVDDPAVRALVARMLDRFEAIVAPAWPALRAQVVHTDLASSNVLVDDAGTITGILDFGDMSHSALVVEAVGAVETLVAGRTGDDVLRTARIALDGFDRVTPLEPEERAIFGELLAARACAGVVVPASRAGMYEDGEALQADLRREAVALLEVLEGLGFDEVARRLGGREPGVGVPVPELAARRRALLGPALTGLSYREPLHLVRGDGVWLHAADGRRYLDAYNNVPVVGHAHPRVAEAIARQSRRLNTNLRYLHGTVLEVAERLLATTEPELDVVMFVNSGSEANDLAWRIARAVTGNAGGLCTAHAYHGISEVITALSPEDWSGRTPPGHVRTWAPPDAYRGRHLTSEPFRAAIAALAEAGLAPAVSILDGVLTSDGILALEPALAAELVRLTHEAGGLWIADEVQGGHGRTGAAMWSYQRLGITPDIVTLGKPMGNGHPVAAVITRRDLAEAFGRTTDFFSTFGGNPVAMAAALAVLDVIEDERIVENARETGDALRAVLREAAAGSPRVGEVRGLGLASAVEIVEPGTTTPDPAATEAIVDGMRRRGVLIGTTGASDSVLKIRPPLVFGRSHAEVLAATFADVLAEDVPG